MIPLINRYFFCMEMLGGIVNCAVGNERGQFVWLLHSVQLRLELAPLKSRHRCVDVFLPYLCPDFALVVVSGWPETLESTRLVRSSRCSSCVVLSGWPETSLQPMKAAKLQATRLQDCKTARLLNCIALLVGRLRLLQAECASHYLDESWETVLIPPFIVR